jgi:predicted amidohydrolase
MRVKIMTNVAGTPSYHSGQVVDVGDGIGEMPMRVAKAWLAEGLAAPVRDEPVETTGGKK